MQQFQDDIMRAKQLALEVEERLLSKISALEQRVTDLEKQIQEKNPLK